MALPYSAIRSFAAFTLNAVLSLAAIPLLAVVGDQAWCSMNKSRNTAGSEGLALIHILSGFDCADVASAIIQRLSFTIPDCRKSALKRHKQEKDISWSKDLHSLVHIQFGSGCLDFTSPFYRIERFPPTSASSLSHCRSSQKKHEQETRHNPK